MQENEFEKNLQQKIDKLQVQPTEELWQKIQEQVAAKKRRRRGVVFFFILSGLVIAVLLLTNINGLYTNETASIKTNGAGQTEINAIKENSVLNSDKVAVNNQNDDKQSQTQTISIANNQKTTTYKSTTTVVGNKNFAKIYPLKIKTKASSRTKIISTKPENDNTVDIAATTFPAENSAVSVNNDRGKNIVAEDKTDSTVAIKDKEALIDVVKKEPLKNENTITKENKKTEKKNHSKWGIAVTVSGGISSTGNRYLSEGQYAVDNTGATPGTGANSGSAYKPSQTKPGFLFVAGINLYREIFKSSRITTGLQYQLINTSIKTGQEIVLSSSSVRDAFIYGTTKNYTNQYHFISIPVSFSTQLFKIGQREICFDAGINFSKLISTNALSFSGGQGLYYKDESVFNKTQTGLNVAVKLNIAANNKAAFYIGPEFYYSVTPLASSGIYANAHANYIGLKLQRNFKK